MIKTPVRGMRDILPSDMELRSYVLGVIQRHAAQAGFAQIETPALEHRENLTSRIGGDNEKLIFEVLKRGASLEAGLTELYDEAINATAGSDPFADEADTPTAGDDPFASETDGPFAKYSDGPSTVSTSRLARAKELLSDSALRYDLTVPLARYYAANQGELNTPFKSLQIGPVWRADAPQKGRYRQFTQCDFDILGDASPLAEVDCITAVGGILQEICTAAGVQNLTITLNDRRILTAVCAAAGFAIDDHPAVLVILDKQDKIGLPGVQTELQAAGFAQENVERLIALLQNAPTPPSADTPQADTDTLQTNAIADATREASQSTSVATPVASDDFAASLQNFVAPLNLDPSIVENLLAIHAAVTATLPVRLIFNPCLVRGMGYYTGPIFEVSATGLSSSIGGGGRYDEMIGRFTGQNVPACGFSIGFERLLVILSDLGFRPPVATKKIALLVSKKVATSDYASVLARAAALRAQGYTASILPMAHNLGKQIGRLEAAGYSEFEKFYGDN